MEREWGFEICYYLFYANLGKAWGLVEVGAENWLPGLTHTEDSVYLCLVLCGNFCHHLHLYVMPSIVSWLLPPLWFVMSCVFLVEAGLNYGCRIFMDSGS